MLRDFGLGAAVGRLTTILPGFTVKYGVTTGLGCRDRWVVGLRMLDGQDDHVDDRRGPMFEPPNDPVDAWYRRWVPERRPVPGPSSAPPPDQRARSIWKIVGIASAFIVCGGGCLIALVSEVYFRESINPLQDNIAYTNDTTRPMVVAKCWWDECDRLLDPFLIAPGDTYRDYGFRPWWLVVAEADGRVKGCVDADDVPGPVKLSVIVDCPADFAIPDQIPAPTATPIR
jgi:hypothetical protein